MIQCNGNNYLTTQNTFTPPSLTTITFWVYPTSLFGTRRILGNNDTWEFRFSNSYLYADIGRAGGNAINGFYAYNWYHIAAVFDSTTNFTRIYVNGQSRQIQYNSGLRPTNYLYFCWRPNASTNERFMGNLEDVRIYNRLLSEEEINSIYINEGLDEIKSSLINWWPLQEKPYGYLLQQNELLHDIISENHIYGTLSTYSNIAIGLPSYASSEQSGNLISYGNDGNTSTRWCAVNGEIGHWWYVDLNDLVNISGVEIMFEKNNTKYDYEIYSSKNGTDWTLVLDKTNNTKMTQTQTEYFTTGMIRYVKIVFTGLESSTWASMYEFRVLVSNNAWCGVCRKLNEGKAI